MDIQVLSENESEQVRLMCINFPDAMEKNSRLVESLSLLFLRFRSFDEISARERLTEYLKWRYLSYGGYEDHLISSDDRMREQLSSGLFNIITDTGDGPALIFAQMRYHDPSSFDAHDTLKCIHFLLMSTLTKYPRFAKNGFSLINDMSGIGLNNLDLKVPELIANAMKKTLPVRVSNLVVYNPPLVVRFVIPVVKLIISNKLGERLHVVTDERKLHEDFQFSPHFLPSTIGGTLELDPTLAVELLVAEDIAV